MRATAYLGFLALCAAPLVSASGQVQRWNDRASKTWGEDSPDVRIYIQGSRTVGYGGPVRVEVETSDDAYVVVGRMDANGRLTILYPRNGLASTFVRGNTPMWIPGRHGDAFTSFYATDYGAGPSYVFALASFTPLDLSAFQPRDFERFGLPSQLSLVNRRYARQPDDYVERFASWVLFDGNTPYSYDYEFYNVVSTYYAEGTSYLRSYGACYAGGSPFMFDEYDGSYQLLWGLSAYSGSCAGFGFPYYDCLGFQRFGRFRSCGPGYRPYIVNVGGRPPIITPYTPRNGDTGVNMKVLMGGIPHPDTVSRVTVEDDRPARGQGGDAERVGRQDAGGAGEHWDNAFTLPNRLRDDAPQESLYDERRKGTATRSPGRTATDPDVRGTRSLPANDVPMPRDRGASRRDNGAARDAASPRGTLVTPDRRNTTTSSAPRPTNTERETARPRERSDAASNPRSAPTASAPRSAPTTREASPRRESPPPRPVRSNPPEVRREPPPRPVQRDAPRPASSSGGERKKPASD